jgi:hypothetical protein
MKTTYKVLIGFVAILLSACAEPDYPTPVATVTGLTSRVTAFHAIAGGPRVQLKFDNLVTAKDTIRYEAANNGKFYSSITINAPAGPNRLVTAAALADGANLVTDRNALVSGTNYSYFVINTPQTIGGVANTPAPAIRRITDDLAAADVGFAKVRFLHFAYDAPEVKVTDVGGATTVFTARKYNEVSRTASGTTTTFTNFSNMVAGTYNLEVRLASDNSLVLSLPNVKLDSKSVYTIYARGLVAGTGATALGYTVFKH